MTIDDAFNKTVAYYDNWVQCALPCYDELFSIAVDCIPFQGSDQLRILDLGAGTGLFSWRVLQQYQHAKFTLVDVADKMLGLARERFKRHSDQVSFIKADYTQFSTITSYDLVISSLSIHHLKDGEKQDLFDRIYSQLKSGGVFVNVDQIKPPTEALRELYWAKWLAEVRKSPAQEDQIQESIRRRKTYDRDSTLVEQLQWLTKAGFAEVDCLYKHYFVGVFYAQR
jgi:tRNA (cmo5U34)-methyltransferase